VEIVILPELKKLPKNNAEQSVAGS